MTPTADPARPAVLIPKRYESLMSLVRRTGRSPDAVFPNAFDLLCFAASLGYARQRTGTIAANSNDKATGGEVNMNVPDRPDRLIADMIAVAHSGTDAILETGRLQERLNLYMEYACGGLDYLTKLAETRTARAAAEVVIRGTDKDTSVDDLGSLVGLVDDI